MIARRSILQHRLLVHIYACSAILSESLIIRAHELIEVLHIQLAVCSVTVRDIAWPLYVSPTGVGSLSTIQFDIDDCCRAESSSYSAT
jgi:hypothetical protein